MRDREEMSSPHTLMGDGKNVSDFGLPLMEFWDVCERSEGGVLASRLDSREFIPSSSSLLCSVDVRRYFAGDSW